MICFDVTTTQDTKALSKVIDVKPDTAVQIQHEIQKANEPTVTYYVQAPDVNTAAKQTQKAINNHELSLPLAINEKSDKTIVNPNEAAQKVDVYKINLNKSHKIKSGVTVIDNKIYPTVGYQAGQFEGLVHFKDNGIKGASILYTVKEW
ncbi:MAG: hypothetical protein E7204_06165 [Veillonella sp.]|uniref:hypothetical protein n=1 Tax=Veillonella sp. TaxID=1926307 RepID=UPI0025DC805A|nr:hypothetical protein [Veillonella sp.]MBE6080403.1 hypothetical protein [Veillonella sp.]